MSKILENLENTSRAMRTEGIREALGLQLQDASIKALVEGMKTGGDWEKYMSLFADNEDQLRLLTVATEGEEGYLRVSRAYMVANAICGADSTSQVALRVDTRIDEGLNSASDERIVDPNGEPPVGAKVRPFRIPKVPNQ